ncbi:AcrR family transcriptional regulator [Streptomyces griseochromogenes]|uniref:AcrR family transcriptional regulator n=1 Tax=Streptomyces griseochromogenes TaxID=68214 RepID=A0A1B1AY41_9ACTN|nr:TetR/AcrR family transcriptional regulator [Streptomyces griseochromogenes]ANP51451.1 TetR family transcriptional regulator [Streptomyces griseochromogenes]MBP2049793.1 AcrR family transcriptional regulator [Streptomyces griseochromogenes]
MSPRQADPEVSANLILAAARLLNEEGPSALSTRRLAAAVGTSTTAVYTYFGGMDDLVRAMVHEGFRRLNDRMTAVPQTDDPVADVAALGYAYRANAIEHQYLYSVMFGGASLGGFALSDDERQHGRYTLETLVGAVDRCMMAGRFRADDPARVAHQMWIGVHGLVTLELGGYLIEPYDADACFQTVVCGMLMGAGDDSAKAAASLEAAGARRG